MANGIGAQNVIITGKITNEETGQGIEGVIVHCAGTQGVAESKAGGFYLLGLPTRADVQLDFQLLGFEKAEKKINAPLWKEVKHDTLHYNVVLKLKPIQSPNVVIYAQKVDTVFGTMKYFVEDFEFSGNRFLLLTFENSLKKAQVKLADENQKVIASVDVPDEAVELFRDFQGYVNVICKENIYRIQVRGDRLVLVSLPVKQFQSEIMPCVDTVPGRILFSNYYRDYPAFSWFGYRVADTSVHKLRSIRDKDLLEIYEEEFDFLKPVDRLAARKMELQSGIDKRIIAAHMTGFAKGVHYTALYAPLFVVNDTSCVFDHYTDRIYRFGKTGNLLDSVPISYHHPKDWKEWKHKLIQDQTTRNVYALLQRNGYYVAKKINLQNGTTSTGYKLRFPYVSRMKARDGFVYYVYRPFESGQTKFLYREKLGG